MAFRWLVELPVVVVVLVEGVVDVVELDEALP